MNTPNRREFVAASTVAGVGLLSGGVFAAGNETIRIGLIGCGGRGSGAAVNALNADPNVKLVAMGDAFPDRLESSLAGFLKKGKLKDKIDVPAERRFTGFDAYKNVIANSDVVLLCTPPHFRPMHLKAAIEAGKHVFCEKPVAVDASGVRSVMETARLAKQKNLALCSGFCYRYEFAKREWVKRIHDGVIGDVTAMQVNYNTGPLWWNREKKDWKPEQYSSMEYQMRNWYYYTWLSGDHLVEQHCHNIDKACWIMNSYPVAATGLGGRQLRTDEKYGNIFDHHSVIFEYENGARVFSFCRQMPGCSSGVSDIVFGTKGIGENQEFTEGYPRLKPNSGSAWKFTDPNSDMYDQEHVELFASIRKGSPINDGESAARSTLMAIMGRTATYTGQRVTWDFMNKSKLVLAPTAYDMAAQVPAELAKVAIPGKTALV
ncbi:Gfo/Idh/MocA family oxidoreductase [Telmatocola sphagniphila]|uniref:Gfo/Idh/MocA family oxidoreductase n=2 Tax=Telmatocola sphagniphila TaxID=1123043 RepID=A0A8E6BBG8_9BACT|nr:Gfo/Idh/MocA family oxidoreductase [Telmatocola sphagniphila]